MLPGPIYDDYWRFAAERLRIYMRRLASSDGPWTNDPVLARYRFTNSYRAIDRVSQHLIADVQYREDRSQAPAEVFFRTILFKLFNRIETWEMLERRFGPLSWQSADLAALSATLDDAMARGIRIYSAAYIMPAPRFGHVRKHANHLALLAEMMQSGLPGRIQRSESLAHVYHHLRSWSGLGDFLAFQYTIDLNYSSLLAFAEDDFVVAGPGALDGMAKCFLTTGGLSASSVIHEMVERQDREFRRLGLDFPGLFGRRLQPIDCQNLLCEIGKYARATHPHVQGTSGRTRIKQGYSEGSPLRDPVFPPKWKIVVPKRPASARSPSQGRLI